MLICIISSIVDSLRRGLSVRFNDSRSYPFIMGCVFLCRCVIKTYIERMMKASSKALRDGYIFNKKYHAAFVCVLSSVHMAWTCR